MFFKINVMETKNASQPMLVKPENTKIVFVGTKPVSSQIVKAKVK